MGGLLRLVTITALPDTTLGQLPVSAPLQALEFQMVDSEGIEALVSRSSPPIYYMFRMIV